MTNLLLALVRFYQLALSPFLGRSCRFHPSCSTYASDAIREHGPAAGVFMAGKRLCKCNPWHPGGYDPVPPGDRKRAPASRPDAHGERCRKRRNECQDDSRLSEIS